MLRRALLLGLALYLPCPERFPAPYTLRGYLADMQRDETTGEWRLWIGFQPCLEFRLGNTLEVRYRGELRKCPRLSAIEADGPVPNGTWLAADHVVIRCRGPTEPDPCVRERPVGP